MIHEIPAARMRILSRALHLPERTHGIQPQGKKNSAGAIMKMKKIVILPLALFDLKPQGNIESLLARATDPEITVVLFVHPNQALFVDARLDHQLMDLHQKLRIQPEAGIGRFIFGTDLHHVLQKGLLSRDRRTTIA